MKKMKWILPLLALLLVACGKKDQITATFATSDFNGHKVILSKVDQWGAEPQILDSTVIENGKFSFAKPQFDKPFVGFVTFVGVADGGNTSLPLIFEPGNIEIMVDSANQIEINGGELNVKLNDFAKETRKVDSEMRQLNALLRQNLSDEARVAEISSELQTNHEKYSNYVTTFIKENIGNKVGEYVFASRVPIDQPEMVEELLQGADPQFAAVIRENIIGGESQQPASEGSSFVGQKFIDVKGQTPDGKTVALSDYVGKGKVVLIDFWASWCGPCIKEIPSLVAAYDKYKGKGFEIVGISLDDKKADWVGAIKQYNMAWPQMSDLKGWKSALSAPYSVQSIPFTLLVDGNGVIIAENLRGKALEVALAKYLK